MVEKHYRLKQVVEITGLSRSTIYEMISKDDFPRPSQLTKKAVGWPESDLADWLQSRKAT